MGARDGLREAAGRLRALWGRGGPPPLAFDDEEEAPAGTAVRLDDVRRRLELLLNAVYGRPLAIVPVQPPPAPPPPGWRDRLLRRRPEPSEAPPEVVAASDGERIHLPPELDVDGGPNAGLARYRLLAVEQAERLARGTAYLAPGRDAPLERDLYLLAESAAVDAAIARNVPGLAPALAAERAAALARRPPPETLTPPEREVEALVRGLLAADPADPPSELAPTETPEESLAAARALAERVRAAGGGYRGLPTVGPWGVVLAAPGEPPRRAPDPRTLPGRRYGMANYGSGPKKGRGGQVTRMGREMGKSDTPPPPGSPPPDAPWEKGAPAAPGAKAPDAPPSDQEGGDVASGEPPKPAAAAPAGTRGDPASARGGVRYPEWDSEAGRYVPEGATVREVRTSLGDEVWAARVLERHAALVRTLRERFERLRARRTRLPRQRDGEELDLAACVRAMVDLRTGHLVDDRLYATVRPARRALSITLLIDVSGSTSEHVGERRIIDIEKDALLLTSEALDALGDAYSILTFSGIGADDVRLRTVKDFGDRNGREVRRRISALQPEGYTRLGAAVRHASALLARQGGGHRLLLILSDGKPNDKDHYQGRYAVEDSRQAIAEARASGVYPFCLTVDRKGSAYLTRIFGRTGHMILSDPTQLPMALVKVVRQILRSG